MARHPGLRRPPSADRRRTPFFVRALVVASLGAGLLCLQACAVADAIDGEDEHTDDVADDGEADSYASTSDALQGPGACAGKKIDRAVECAKSKGAEVLSFYRSPEEQERVRRENGCTNRCTGSAGCVRPTAGCSSSPHTRCTAVDLVNDGAPATKAQLRACGLAKTTAPHRNHYDLIR
jgi:hypothetical protein